MSNEKKVISVSVALTVLIILFGNNWIPRIFNNLIDETNIDAQELENDLQSDGDSSIKYSSKLIEKTEAQDSSDLIRHSKENSSQSNNPIKQLDVGNDYSIDTLHRLLLSGQLNFVSKYFTDRKEYFRIFDKNDVENLRLTINAIKKLEVDYVYFDTAGDMIITLKDERYGFVSYNYQKIWKEMFDIVEPTEITPLTYVSRSGKWGVIGKDGKIIIPVIYDDFNSQFEDVNFFSMTKNGNIHIFDKTGEKITKDSYGDLYRVSNEHFLIKKNRYSGLINLEGRIVLGLEYDSIQVDLSSIKRYRVYLDGSYDCLSPNLANCQ